MPATVGAGPDQRGQRRREPAPFDASKRAYPPCAQEGLPALEHLSDPRTPRHATPGGAGHRAGHAAPRRCLTTIPHAARWRTDEQQPARSPHDDQRRSARHGAGALAAGPPDEELSSDLQGSPPTPAQKSPRRLVSWPRPVPAMPDASGIHHDGRHALRDLLAMQSASAARLIVLEAIGVQVHRRQARCKQLRLDTRRSVSTLTGPGPSARAAATMPGTRPSPPRGPPPCAGATIAVPRPAQVRRLGGPVAAKRRGVHLLVQPPAVAFQTACNDADRLAASDADGGNDVHCDGEDRRARPFGSESNSTTSNPAPVGENARARKSAAPLRSSTMMKTDMGASFIQ